MARSPAAANVRARCRGARAEGLPQRATHRSDRGRSRHVFALRRLRLTGATSRNFPDWLQRSLDLLALPRIAPWELHGTIHNRRAPWNRLAGVPVFAGAMDAWATAVGAGAVRPGHGYDIAGTSEVAGLITRARAEVPGLVSLYWSGNAWQVGGPTQAGADCAAWCHRTFRIGRTLSAAVERAGGLPPADTRPIFLPYLAGERAPLWRPDLRGSFVGIAHEHGGDDFLWSVLEGVAMAMRDILTRATRGSATRMREVRVAGGGAQSNAWCQLKADVMNVAACADVAARDGRCRRRNGRRRRPRVASRPRGSRGRDDPCRPGVRAATIAWRFLCAASAPLRTVQRPRAGRSECRTAGCTSTPVQASACKRRSMSPRSEAGFIATYGTALAALLFVFFAVAAPNFLNPTNLLNVLKQVSFLAILAIGFSIALHGRRARSFVRRRSAACARWSSRRARSSSRYAPAAGGRGGARRRRRGRRRSTACSSRALRIPSLIATLAMASVATGIAFAITGGVAFVGRWDPALPGARPRQRARHSGADPVDGGASRSSRCSC